MAGEMSKWAKIRAAAVTFFDEKAIATDEKYLQSRAHRYAHFWLMVGKSFHRNRCPVRAAALSYTMLLALVPLLAVGVSITTSMLQKRGEQPIQDLISKLVDYVAPALDLEARAEEEIFEVATNTPTIISTNTAGQVVTNTLPAINPPRAVTGRERVVTQITSFISKINSGALGITSVLALLFVGISLLRTIEATFNDIWGVTRGRPWFKSIVYYWAVITLGPIFLVGALTLTTGPHLEDTREWLDRVPILGNVLFVILPFVILSLGFSAFYALMPNTKVSFTAALVGGTIGGCLWQLNNLFNVIYVSRVVTYTNIYGSLAVLPLFLVGMYFSWLIMLFGAQVAYAWQNRDAYIQEKQAEGVSQRGREFVAMRLMTHISRNFLAGGRPLSLVELSRELTIPSQLAQRVLCSLVHNGLLVEATDTDIRFSPGRPLDRINAYHIISALRDGGGHELATSEDESRLMVRTEFERMIQAERDTGSGITMQSLAELSAKQVGSGARGALEQAPSVRDGKA